MEIDNNDHCKVDFFRSYSIKILIHIHPKKTKLPRQKELNFRILIAKKERDMHIPDNCRRRGRRRQCKFFWPV